MRRLKMPRPILKPPWKHNVNTTNPLVTTPEKKHISTPDLKNVLESLDIILKVASPIADGLDVIPVMKGVVGVAQLLVNMGKVCSISAGRILRVSNLCAGSRRRCPIRKTRATSTSTSERASSPSRCYLNVMAGLMRCIHRVLYRSRRFEGE